MKAAKKVFYESPSIEVKKIEAVDIITTSGTGDNSNTNNNNNNNLGEWDAQSNDW